MAKNGSQKFSNYEYAPGIATYGIDGVDGKSGKNGTSVFICQYSTSNLSDFGTAILQNLNMSLNSTEKLDRDYIEGDCFLFNDGNIWKIEDLNGLKSAAASSQLKTLDDLSKYMTQVGSIILSDSMDGFTQSNNNKLVLDTTNYKGFVVNKANLSTERLNNIDAPVIIASDDTDNDDKVEFINMKSIFSGVDESEMTIYYDSNNDAYHINSDKPIVIDGNLLVKYDDNVNDFDEYSRVLTSDNSITAFHNICENITYAINNIKYDTTGSKATSSITPISKSIFDNLKSISWNEVTIKSGIITHSMVEDASLYTPSKIVSGLTDISTDDTTDTTSSDNASTGESSKDTSTGTNTVTRTYTHEIYFTNMNSESDTISAILTNATIHIVLIKDNIAVKDIYYQCKSGSSLNDNLKISIDSDITDLSLYSWKISVIGNIEVKLKETED